MTTMNEKDKLTELLELILNGTDLSQENASYLMDKWLNDEITPVQTGAFLGGFRMKQATGDELAAMANVLLKACCLPISRPNLFLVDTCGTGGDGSNSFNISTAVAFVSSAYGVNISKHGNRSASGKVGSADVLANLGLNLNSSLDKVISAIENVGVTFLFAPAWHKSLINLAPLRKSLGVRTIFNQLGPLVNPVRPNAQVLGVASEDLLHPMASALKNLGMKRAIVINGFNGLDEASLEGDNKLILLNEGKLSESKLNISDFGFKNVSNSELVVKEGFSNEDILKSVLSGNGKEAHINAVALNTALVLWTAGLEDDFEIGINKALDTMKSGKPWEKFLKLKKFLQD